ncbi:MAG: VWA domain-containing protein, partial [Acidimicrobiia bacterium]
MIVACLLGAVASLSLPGGGGGVATVVLVDGSDSMGAAGRAEALSWVGDAIDGLPRDARAGVALFGGDARVERTVSAERTFADAAVQVDASRTDLAGALRLAAAILPSDSRRRIVVVSDGRATEGDAATEARRLRQAGIAVDVHPVEPASGDDTAVSRLDAPALARQGESVTVAATITASRPGAVRVTLAADDEVVDERTVDVTAGDNDIEFTHTPTGSGLVRYRLDVDAAGDAIAQNDTAYTAVTVEGPARVLVAEGASGEGAALAGALRAGGLDTDLIAATQLPAVDRLSAYASVVLVDVDARALSPEQVAGLSTTVRDLGRGLVVVGGDQSYALGGYRDSELERLLPVISDVTDPKRRQSVAEVLAIDSSGSMAACHCREGEAPGMGGNFNGGGVNKTDISREAAARAIAALSADDQVGILAFNTEQKFVVPLQQLPSAAVVQKGLRSLVPAGGTDLLRPLQTAAAELRQAKARLKHIVLFTDGFTAEFALDDLVAQAAALADEGITVSVLATGEGASEELKAVADAGRGRFYPGRDLNEIPQLMAQEVVLASRNFVNEGEFHPEVVGPAPAAERLTRTPALLGFRATTPKPTAVTDLRIGPEDDPLLACWRVGLGRA